MLFRLCWLGGQGGRKFDDELEVKQRSGRSFDEFRLCEVEFFTWQAVGAVRCTYSSVIDGLTVVTDKHGRYGDSREVLTLSSTESIVAVCGACGFSRDAAGATCIDVVDMRTVDLDGASSSQATRAQHFRVLSGAAKNRQGFVNGADRVRGAMRSVVKTSFAQQAFPEAACIECTGDYHCPLHDPGSPAQLAEQPLVVRAIHGRAGDSLDGIDFVLGPPIPQTWSPEAHKDLPSRTRRAVYGLLLASQREECIVHKLDRDCLWHLFSWVAAHAELAGSA